ncbi:hypothetical protein ACIF70_30210 [Actinacidiphila glaucinigra]|uniref:hypothetical protein n=1 Tax=Actinacidiphila glaucinigra TaxID=235986 RepID=UPI002DDC2394|nr:hypothetical protein [Actinacidiphila glaucinigra]WSD64161.1 hypothetical protein OIE69_37385 [Actinacidiphila glaucinigra]
MEEAIPLSRGDVHWVFPDLEDTDAVAGALTTADALVSRLAGHLGVRAGRTGSVLEYLRLEGHVLAGVFGCAERPEVSFHARLYFPRRCLWDLRWGPPWDVEAEVRVPCDRETDCGGHTLAVSEHTYVTPVDSARGLVRATTWLLTQGVSRPPDAWRSLDPGCGCLPGLVD